MPPTSRFDPACQTQQNCQTRRYRKAHLLDDDTDDESGPGSMVQPFKITSHIMLGGVCMAVGMAQSPTSSRFQTWGGRDCSGLVII